VGEARHPSAAVWGESFGREIGRPSTMHAGQSSRSTRLKSENFTGSRRERSEKRELEIVVDDARRSAKGDVGMGLKNGAHGLLIGRLATGATFRPDRAPT
jgi:hypothetical protein